MLVDITTVEDAVKFAQRIARKMSKDPEVDSIAGEAAWKALYTYDIKKNVKLSWWIAQLTKQSVQYYWRQLATLRQRERLMDELWWHKQTKKESNDDLSVPSADWQLLVESFVLRLPLDVLARQRGVSMTVISTMRQAAISRLEAAC